jgi:hypothetical protein
MDKAFPQPVLAMFPVGEDLAGHTYAADVAVVQKGKFVLAHILKPPANPDADFHVKTPVKTDGSVSLRLNNSDASGEISVGQWAYFYGQLPIGITPTVVGGGESGISTEPDTAEFIMYAIAGPTGALEKSWIVNVSDKDHEMVTLKCRSGTITLPTLKRGEVCEVDKDCNFTKPVQYSTVPEVNKWVLDIQMQLTK